RRELVRDPLDLHRGDRGALERREEDAAKRVAERVAEAAVERLDHEDAAVLVDLLVDDLRNLVLHPAGANYHLFISSALLLTALARPRCRAGRRGCRAGSRASAAGSRR